MPASKRHSKKREAILLQLSRTKAHPSAKDLYETMRQEYPDISLATVYRNLALFKEEGRVITVAVVDGEERFDANVEPHTHFVCTRCGAVIDLDLLHSQELDLEVERQYSVEVDHHTLIFYGSCGTCSRPKS